MKCPQCRNETVRYRIWGDRYSLKCNREESGRTLGIWIKKAAVIGRSWSFMRRPYVLTHRCATCRIQIIVEEENHYKPRD